jgi:transposase
MSTMIEHSTELATVGSAGREGGCGPSALSPGQRWSVARKREVVLRLLRGEAAEDLSRELAVPVYRLERWRERALAGIEGALKEREGDPLKDELGAAMRRLGELTMENELLRARAERPGPLARRRSR